MMMRLENVQKHKREALVKVANMSVMINILISKEGEQIDQEHHEGLAEIISSTKRTVRCPKMVTLATAKGASQKKKKDSSGMRLHPLIVR